VDTLQTTDDFSALRWFHENGVPQVIQTTRLMLDVLGSAEKGLPRPLDHVSAILAAERHP
jgi:hypothetical protein